MSLHVYTAGKGPVLVLLHGWGLNSRVWDSVLPRLNKSFTTVCIDLPGHGQSPWPPAFHDIDSLSSLIEPYITSRASSLDPSSQEGQQNSDKQNGCFLLG